MIITETVSSVYSKLPCWAINKSACRAINKFSCFLETMPTTSARSVR